jgi:transcriptional regulator with XRE-family HTH domain
MPRLFGAKLRYLRRKRGMVQQDLAVQLELARQGHITNLETGKDVASLALILRAANFFQVSADSLLRDSIPVTALDEYMRVTSQSMLAPEHFGSRLRDLRLHHNMTLGALAHHLGLAIQSTVSNLELGRKWPSPELVVKVSDLFNIPTDYLLSPVSSTVTDRPAPDC